VHDLVQGDPESDGSDVQDLIQAHLDDQADLSLRSLPEEGLPPRGWLARVDQDVDQCQYQARFPTQCKAKQQGMDATVHPRSRMTQTGLVSGHPVVLQNPVCYQVGDEAALKGRQHSL
jgi:hypothetical protein